jgi:hypothetical protein
MIATGRGGSAQAARALVSSLAGMVIICCAIAFPAEARLAPAGKRTSDTGSTWDLARDFEARPGMNPAPDAYGDPGVWSFEESSGLAHDGIYQRFAASTSNYTGSLQGVAGLDAWHDYVGPCPILPIVGLNSNSSAVSGDCVPSIPANTAFVVPDDGQMAVVQWRSPVSGTVGITGLVADLDSSAGDGVRWYVDDGTQTIASGVLANGGSAFFPPSLHVDVQIGDILSFIVDPGPNEDSRSDTTQLDAGISTAAPLVQGRVVEGSAGHQTLSTTQWVASFVSPYSSKHRFAATVDWGDASPPTIGKISSAEIEACTYTTTPPPGQCFVVSGRHQYALAGDYVVTVDLTEPGGSGSAQGIAEIIDGGLPAKPSKGVGVLTFHSEDSGTWERTGSWEGCTAEALANVDVVMTVGHCAVNASTPSAPTGLGAPNFDFEFGPQHKGGDCWAHGSPPGVDLLACESLTGHTGRPVGVDPLGVWSLDFVDHRGNRDLTGVMTSTTTVPNDAIAFIVLSQPGSTGGDLRTSVPGLPVHFLPPRGQSWEAFGYPLYEHVWNLRSCPSTADSSVSGQFLELKGCNFGFPASAKGISGGAWVSGGLGLKFAAGAVNDRFFPPDVQRGPYLDNGAMRAYVDAVLASMG